jgi:hypothetical protein
MSVENFLIDLKDFTLIYDHVEAQLSEIQKWIDEGNYPQDLSTFPMRDKPDWRTHQWVQQFSVVDKDFQVPKSNGVDSGKGQPLAAKSAWKGSASDKPKEVPAPAKPKEHSPDTQCVNCMGRGHNSTRCRKPCYCCKQDGCNLWKCKGADRDKLLQQRWEQIKGKRKAPDGDGNPKGSKRK